MEREAVQHLHNIFTLMELTEQSTACLLKQWSRTQCVRKLNLGLNVQTAQRLLRH